MRVTKRSQTFQRDFLLAGFDAPIPAGITDIEHHEEQIEGLSFIAYRRVSTTIALPSGAQSSRLRQNVEIVDIDPADLARAVEQDMESIT